MKPFYILIVMAVATHVFGQNELVIDGSKTKTIIPLSANQINQAAETASAVQSELVERMSNPDVFRSGIEVPVLVLISLTNQTGVGVIATDSGELITYTDHNSPRPPAEEIKRRQMAAIEAHKAKRQKQAAATNDFGKGQLQDRIAAIEAWIAAQESTPNRQE
jgi:hypothetical protein